MCVTYIRQEASTVDLSLRPILFNDELSWNRSSPFRSYGAEMSWFATTNRFLSQDGK